MNWLTRCHVMIIRDKKIVRKGDETLTIRRNRSDGYALITILSGKSFKEAMVLYSKDEQENYALMAYSNSGLDTESEEVKGTKSGALVWKSQMNKGVLSMKIQFWKFYFTVVISNSSEEINESVPKPVANEPKAVSDPKVWSDAPIIEEYESDSDESTCFSHLIRDFDFHEKRMAKQVELNKKKGKEIITKKPLIAQRIVVISGCSRHMTGNKAHLAEYQDYRVGPVAFGCIKDKGRLIPEVEEPKTNFQTEELHLSGVELKNVEDIERPRPTSTRSVLTLKPLPKIDPKAKGKGMIEEEDESDTESEDITEAEKKFKMLTNDEEMAIKVQDEWEAEEEKERLTEKEATKAAFTNEYDFIQARLNADKILAEKHVGGKKHSDLKTKIFEEIQVLYEKVKRSDENFIAIGSLKDERLIKDLNKKAAGIKKADSIKEESKEEEGTKKRKLGTRKKMNEKENDELRLCLTIAPDKDKEVDYEILDKKYPITEWKFEYLGIKPQYDETKDLEEINLNVVIRSNGQRRYFNEIPEDFDKVLWGDLMIMFNPSDEDEFWNSQQDWNVVSWKLHGASGVHTLMTEAGLVIHMLVEKKYPLRKKVLLQMLELKLESEEDSTMALELIRFVMKLIAELEPEKSNGYEEDL
ncbi:hypothetical protein Tco_0936604 [Tanacetum coccineum]|uniref:Uncharacterized protein n=1 Tax=Tanacetum coccineum TaxID=301880 RepID=A0ABQ5DCK8_9ASTR